MYTPFFKSKILLKEIEIETFFVSTRFRKIKQEEVELHNLNWLKYKF